MHGYTDLSSLSTLVFVLAFTLYPAWVSVIELKPHAFYQLLVDVPFDDKWPIYSVLLA